MLGNFNKIIDRSKTDCIKYDLRRETFGKEDVIPMWIADMDFRAPECVLKALRERINHGVLGYGARLDCFFKSIIDWNKLRNNREIDPEWIVFSPGVVPAFTVSTLALTEPGDSVIIQPPVYPPFFDAVKQNRRNLVCNPLINNNGYFTFDYDNFREICQKHHPKVLILCNPHNPVGRAWTFDELKKLTDLCLEYGVTIISDEIHSDLLLHGNQFIPTASISKEVENITLSASAPSKTFNIAGLSTSYIIISNPVLREKVQNVYNHMHLLSGNVFGNLALQTVYEQGVPWLESLLQYLSANAKYATNFINKRLKPIQTHLPEATFLMWLDCRGLNMSEKEIDDIFIQKAGVGFNLGTEFGSEGDGFFRMNIGCPRQTLKTALENIEKALK
ncbi:MAG: PatB family C-S lyase [Bacteroidales bacterium]|nr:PatB family C-S lyase [Bacteroidales bacterium]